MIHVIQLVFFLPENCSLNAALEKLTQGLHTHMLRTSATSSWSGSNWLQRENWRTILKRNQKRKRMKIEYSLKTITHQYHPRKKCPRKRVSTRPWSCQKSCRKEDQMEYPKQLSQSYTWAENAPGKCFYQVASFHSTNKNKNVLNIFI